MTSLSRKEFLKTSALVLAGLACGGEVHLRKQDPLLSFSTLGCPDWTFEQITNFAVQHGYKGIELRGLQREMDLTKSPEFNTEANRKPTLALMKSKGLSFVGLGSSANLHFKKGAEREKNLDEAKRFIDLAQQIHCPYVRVFPNKFPKEQTKIETIDLIVKGLLELGDYAKQKNVNVLLETHGDVVKIDDLLTIMKSAEHDHVGLVWDISNMWTVTKESPSEAWNALHKYIRHTHIKDAHLVNDKLSYTLLGEGDVPIFEAIKLLAKGGYKGYYSFEWEKMWHPDIAEPEIALAHYPKAMKKYFNGL
ncbi:MAG: sugar phosphate isomerase/epimerase [Bacteroidota bacterium]|nr:sugar phosphate isomerase/epimerase [Bacteroidota bacterium]